MLMSLFGHSQMSFRYASTPLGIGISLFVVIIASVNLIIDFDMIETGARMGAPKYMEWYGAFGLRVTLVWLYMEMLRLLSKVRRREFLETVEVDDEALRLRQSEREGPDQK